MNIFKLYNQVKHYEWGSPDYIPQLMGLAADGRPWAELWMGSHPESPSWVKLPSGEITLDKLISGDPCYYLGEKTAERFDGLPYLLKLLAADKPLSIQAHPNLAQAREGFQRENRAGLALNAPHRSYRDSNHKPEILCALTPFTGMCGFREPDEICRLLVAFLESAPALVREGFSPLLGALKNNRQNAESSVLRDFLNALFDLSPALREALTEYILSGYGTGDGSAEMELVRNCARLYPGDPAVISPLYLNVFCLEPGEAVFLNAGILHAYCRGFGVELMANSDNVLRGGLTPKHIDLGELMKVLDFSPMKPRIMKPASAFSRFRYPDSCEEFSLTVMRGSGGAESFVPDSPAICLVTQGEVSISSRAGDNVLLKQGESAFIPPNTEGNAAGNAAGEGFILEGNYTLYAASCGLSPS